MSGASAFDPSTWGDEEHDANEALYAPGGPLSSEAVAAETLATAVRQGLIDREALNAELADLRELERSTQAQMDKASATVTAAKRELSRLQQRIAEVEQDIEASHSAESEG